MHEIWQCEIQQDQRILSSATPSVEHLKILYQKYSRAAINKDFMGRKLPTRYAGKRGRLFLPVEG